MTTLELITGVTPQITENLIGWDGTRFTTTGFVEVRESKVDWTWNVTVAGKSVNVPSTTGFWLDGNREIFAAELVPGKSKIYVKSGDTIKLETVTEVERLVEPQTVYTICGTDTHNFLFNDVLLHNFDLDDYRVSKIIGKGNVESNQMNWSDMFLTARATRDAHVKALNELTMSSMARTLRWDLTTEVANWQAILNELTSTYIQYDRAFMICFNSLIGPEEQETGVVTYNAIKWTLIALEDEDTGVEFAWPDIDDRETSYDIDYTGKLTFDPSYYTDMVAGFKAFNAAKKKFCAIALGWNFGEYDYPSAPPINGWANKIEF